MEALVYNNLILAEKRLVQAYEHIRIYIVIQPHMYIANKEVKCKCL